MMNKKLFAISVLICLALCLSFAAITQAGTVTLSWDPNDPAPEGYRIFAREEGKSYDYAVPVWDGDGKNADLKDPNRLGADLINLTEGTTYYFVVRAYEGLLESADSEEVNYTMPSEGIPKVTGAGVERVVIEVKTTVTVQ